MKPASLAGAGLALLAIASSAGDAFALGLAATQDVAEPPKQAESEAPDAPTPIETEDEVDTSDEAVIEAIGGGLAYLLSTQNEDGSWGGPKNQTFTSSFGNPATYKSWAVGTTALATLSLLKLGEDEAAAAAAERGLDYLIANADLKRPADWDVDNVWGLTYGLDTLAKAMRLPRYAENAERLAELRAAGQEMVNGLREHASPRGGWGYYSSARDLWQPEWATSFTTAVGLLALVEAKESGLDVPQDLFDATVRTLERCRLPNGAYTYSVNAVPPRLRLESINQVKGSLGRIQVCNLALYRAGAELPEGALEEGLELFFRHHRFLDVARNKPIPHEAYYAVAAYFYLFGHYYAAAVIDSLPEESRKEFVAKMRYHVMKCRQKDGAFWDFWIASSTKPYGTAFSVMSLAHTVDERR